MRTADNIKAVLQKAFQIKHLEVIDESYKHAGHSEAARAGGSHFQVMIVSPDFVGKTLVQRHRMVNDALKAEFIDGMHALAIKAKTPQEI
jgi:BolA protein